MDDRAIDTNRNLDPNIDPIAYRKSYDPNDIIGNQPGQKGSGTYDPMADLNQDYISNMDMNKQIRWANQSFSLYWDDSSRDKQSTLWWLNDKYTGEGVKTSDINYNAELKIGDLNSNFVYWKQSQVYGTDHPWYISQRNDDIASALYNEWRVSKEEVQKFLESQNWFFNSSEEDRANTIESVWKRLGDIAKMNNKEDEKEEEKPEFWWKQTDEEGMIYWRASGNDDTSIETNKDTYSTEALNLRARQLNYQSLQSMDSYDIALIESSGASLYGETAMRDLATYDPQKYKEIQEYKKQIQAWETVNAIASWEHGSATEQINKSDDVVNDGITKWTQANSNERTYDEVQELLTWKLANSQTANSATQEMLNIKAEIAELEEKMANLPKEAQKAFKGDVPQYIVDAFVSNNAQRYQSEINKLQSRYQGALDLYKIEVSQKQWEAEMDLKERQFSFDKNQQTWENNFKAKQQAWENDFKNRQQGWTEYYQWQSLLLSNWKIKTDKDGKPYIINDDWTYTYLTDATYSKLVEEQVQQWVESLNSTWFDWMTWGQCEAFTDSWVNSVYWQTMTPIDENGNPISWRNWTYGSEKAQYVNTAIPKKWVIAIFKYPYTANVSNAAKTYWHTMIVTGYDPSTQMLTLKWSNRTWDEKVYTTQMSLQDFRTKYYGAGFWDPSRPTWFQKEDDGAVETTQSVQSMNKKFWTLIKNASTQWTKDWLATAQAMYNTLSEIRDNWSLEHLVESWDFEKVLNWFNTKKFTTDDWGSMFAQQLREMISKKVPDVQSQIALNKLLWLVEQKLRKESWAAISSSEWLSNFERMVPWAYEDINLMGAKLTNWDDVIREYAVAWWMWWDEYEPIFNNEWMARETWAG